MSVEYRAVDPGVTRYLPCIIVADDGGDHEHMQKLAEHTARVRAAKSFSYEIVVDGWEADGVPWEPNQLVSVTDEMLGFDGESLLIVSVTATVDRDSGDVTRLTVCPPEAYEQIALPEETKAAKASKKKGKKKGKKTSGKSKKSKGEFRWR